MRLTGYVEWNKRTNRGRIIPDSKVLINRHTPVGDDAGYYEVKPYNGRREFRPHLHVRNGAVDSCWWARQHNWTKKRWEFAPSEDFRKFLLSHGVRLPRVCKDGTRIVPVSSEVV
jgi:hypothetical protein